MRSTASIRAPRAWSLAGVILAIAGCQPAAASLSTKPETSLPAPEDSGSGARESSGAEVRLTILDHQQLHLRALRQLIPRFEAEVAAQGRTIRVEIIEGPDNDEEFGKQVEAAYQGGSAPDLTSYPGAFVPDFASRGFLLDLTDRLATWPDWQEHFYETLRERAVQDDSRIYSIPRGANVVQLFYRRDVLEANGISTDQPRSWSDLLARMSDLRAKTGRPTLLIPGGKTWGGGGFDEGFINLVLGTDSPLYDEATDRWVVRSSGLRAVFAFYESMVRAGVLPVEPLLDPSPWEPTKFLSFPAGDLAVTTQGTWGWTFDWGPNGRAPIPNLRQKVATWRFPTGSGAEPFVWAAENWMWTISSRTSHPDEAFELLKWLNRGEALAVDLAAVGNVAPRDDIAAVSPYGDQSFLVEDERLLPVGRSFKARLGIDRIQQAAAMATEGVISGRLSAPEAAEEFARLATDALGPDRVTEAP
jgi:multiple sugar transport system substrate-binding protein